MINNLIGGLFGKVVENAEGILDKCITTDKERDAAKLAIKKLMLEAEKEAFAKEVEDRKSARDLYKDDAIIQKVLATLFTVAYFGISFVMFQHFVGGWHRDVLNPWTGEVHVQESMIGILYINTNNGYTLLETGDKIESVENRLLLFPCHIMHTGITQTDTKIRVVINFNFMSHD